MSQTTFEVNKAIARAKELPKEGKAFLEGYIMGILQAKETKDENAEKEEKEGEK